MFAFVGFEAPVPTLLPKYNPNACEWAVEEEIKLKLMLKVKAVGVVENAVVRYATALLPPVLANCKVPDSIDHTLVVALFVLMPFHWPSVGVALT